MEQIIWDYIFLKVQKKKIRMKPEQLDGMILLNKPLGYSSNFALQRVKRVLAAKKAGHMGTLDPFAAGLLLCCMGRATKISSTILHMKKTYQAVLQFGEETDSGDLTGNITATAVLNSGFINKENLENTLLDFLGTIKQLPPMYSALKRNGKPLYKYARQGIELERSPRLVDIYKIDLLSYSLKNATLEITCGRGTYIRTLAQDIGRAMGCFAHLLALKRTQIGPFILKNAIDLDFLESAENPREALISLDKLKMVFYSHNNNSNQTELLF